MHSTFRQQFKKKKKKELLTLLKDSQAKSNDYMKQFHKEYIDKLNL